MKIVQTEETDGSISEAIVHTNEAICPYGYEISPRKFPPLSKIDWLIIKTDKASGPMCHKTMQHYNHQHYC